MSDMVENLRMLSVVFRNIIIRSVEKLRADKQCQYDLKNLLIIYLRNPLSDEGLKALNLMSKIIYKRCFYCKPCEVFRRVIATLCAHCKALLGLIIEALENIASNDFEEEEE